MRRKNNILRDGLAELATALKRLVASAEKAGIVPDTALAKEIQAVLDDSEKVMKPSSRLLVIAVAGKFSSGKSQFINSLIGCDISPVALKPTTCCKTVFTGGEVGSKSVRIVDEAGNSIPEDEYRKLASAESADGHSFSVFLPGTEWKDLALVDTPGFDAVGRGNDRQISREAVQGADVVFFVVSAEDGTLKEDAKAYLKEVAKDNSHVYLFANKADVRFSVIPQVMDEMSRKCKDSGIRTEGVMPYCSLTETSPELRSLTESGRQDCLKMAGTSRQKAWNLIRRLVARKSQIQAARNAGTRSAVRERLHGKADKALLDFEKRLEQAKTELEQDVAGNGEAWAKDIAALLADWAETYMENHPPDCPARKIPGPGWFRNWEVSWDASSAQYDLDASEAFQLAGEIREAMKQAPDYLRECEHRFPEVVGVIIGSCLQELGNCPDFKLKCDSRRYVPDLRNELKEKVTESFLKAFKPRALKAAETIFKVAHASHAQTVRKAFGTKTKALKDNLGILRSLLEKWAATKQEPPEPSISHQRKRDLSGKKTARKRQR